MELTLTELEALVQRAAAKGDMLPGMKHDVPAGGPITTVGYSHGANGLFSLAGPDQRMWSTIVGIKSLATRLPVTAPSVDMNPLVQYLTGVTAGSGDEPDSLCDDAPTAGFRKSGLVNSPFGNYQRQTAQLQINRLGQRVNRGESTDFFVQNMPEVGGSLMSPSFPGGQLTAQQIINTEVKAKFFELQIEFTRLLADQLWTGDPTNNVGTYPNDSYSEFQGLEKLVNTGYRDALNQTRIAALDSDVKDFGGGRMETAGPALVTYLTYLWRYLNYNADSMNIPNVEWALVMRPSAFWVLSDIWPCAFNTSGCVVPSGSTQFIDATGQREMGNDMRRRNFLPIDGVEVPVILDNYLPETQPVGGVFESDIYLVPLRAMGMPVLYWEHFDERNPEITTAINDLGPQGIFTTGNGEYIVWTKRTNLCIQWQAKIRPRLRLLTPWLAGRLNNVRYSPLQHERDANPAGQYFANGGNTSRPAQAFYSVNAA